MSKGRNYKGIEIFRVVAAFLVIAIHTSPLTTYSQTADFIFTRVIARVAVPFSSWSRASLYSQRARMCAGS